MVGRLRQKDNALGPLPEPLAALCIQLERSPEVPEPTATKGPERSRHCQSCRIKTQPADSGRPGPTVPALTPVFSLN